MSDLKRPRFQINTEVTVGTEEDGDVFIKSLNNMLSWKKSSDNTANQASMETDSDIVKSDIQVANLLTNVATTPQEIDKEFFVFKPADPKDTYFPFSKEFKFQASGGSIPSVFDYLVNVTLPYEPAEGQKKFYQAEKEKFYVGVPWVQLHNNNHVLTFKEKYASKAYESPYLDSLSTNQLYNNNIAFETGTIGSPDKFTDRVLRIRRPIVSTDILSFLILLLSGVEQSVVTSTIEKYFGIVKGVYGQNKLLKGEELTYAYGGVMSFFSEYKKNDSTTIEESVDNYWKERGDFTKESTFLRYLILSGLYINDYDTRVGFITDPEYNSQIDQRLAQVDAYIRLFRSFAGLTEGRETMFYQDFMEGFDKFMEGYKEATKTRAIQDDKTYYQSLTALLNNSSLTLKTLTTATTAIGTSIFGSAAGLAADKKKLSEEVSQKLDEVRKELTLMSSLIKDLTVMTSPYNMEVARFGTEIRSLIQELRKIYVLQKAEIKMWKDMYEDLKKTGSSTSNKAKVNLSKSSELTVNSRNYLNLLIKQFLMTNPLMKLIYNVCGTAQLKDISNYLNFNLVTFLLEELCESIPSITTTWQELDSIKASDFGLVKTSTKTILMYFERHDDKAFQMLQSAEYFLSPPVYKSFMETFQYVELLHRKGSCPMSLSTLVSEDFKGVSLEMASMVSALMTKEQDIQKQHATTRFDKPGINMAVVQARLSVRKKMEIHLGCSFAGLERVELII